MLIVLSILALALFLIWSATDEHLAFLIEEESSRPDSTVEDDVVRAADTTFIEAYAAQFKARIR